MRVSVLQESLRAGLAIVGAAATSRTTLPVLGNVLLEAKDDQLRLAATNLEIALVAIVAAKVDEAGAITVPVRLLSEWVSGLPAGRIDMEVAQKTMTLNLSCAGAQARMMGIDAEDFPAVEIGEEAEAHWPSLDVPAKRLAALIEKTAFAAARDESRKSLMGVQVTHNGGCLRLAATDGYRLALAQERLPVESQWSEALLIPAASLLKIARICRDVGGGRTVHVLVDGAQENGAANGDSGSRIRRAVWRIPGAEEGSGVRLIEASTLLLGDKYPDIRAIIPKTCETTVVVDASLLTMAVRRARLFARDNADIVYLDIGDGGLMVASSGADLGDGENSVPANVSGPALSTAFKGSHLVDALAAIDGGSVCIEFTSRVRPGAFYADGTGRDDAQVVIMPMHRTRADGSAR